MDWMIVNDQTRTRAAGAFNANVLAKTRRLESLAFGLAHPVKPRHNGRLVHRALTLAAFQRIKRIGTDQFREQFSPRVGTIEEVGRIALFLATEDSSFLTGQAIEAEGGASLDY